MTPATAPPFESCGMETPSADLVALADLVRLARRPDAARTVALEVGSWAGRTAAVMADAGAHVYCVDTWEGGDDPADDTAAAIRALGGPDALYAAFCRNMGGRLYDTVYPRRGTSAFWAAKWAACFGPLDLVFLDGDHRYDAIRADALAWAPHVRPGGILCGHDYGIFPGVTRAVDELFPGRGRAGFCLWWARAGG